MFPLAAELGDFDSSVCKVGYLSQVELMPRLVSLLHCDSARITGPLPLSYPSPPPQTSSLEQQIHTHHKRNRYCHGN